MDNNIIKTLRNESPSADAALTLLNSSNASDSTQPNDLISKLKNKNKSKNTKRSKRIKVDPREPLIANTLVGTYKLEKVTGRGSFSLVYKGVDSRTQRRVIAKEYFPKRFAKRSTSTGSIIPLEHKNVVYNEGHKQFFKEALILKIIMHPNIIKSIDLFRDNNTAYMIFPATGGNDLKWFLRSTLKPINQKLIIQIFMPILSALNFMHSAGLLHLDLKPANMLLQPTGEALLIDLGASQVVSTSFAVNNFQTLTHGFAPQEQYDKYKALGSWTDIYSISATIFCCIKLKPPSKAIDGHQPSQLNVQKYSKRYSQSLLNAINLSLLNDPNSRINDVDYFAQQLLEGSDWTSLQDYEIKVMRYNRLHESVITSTKEVIKAFNK